MLVTQWLSLCGYLESIVLDAAISMAGKELLYVPNMLDMSIC